MDLTGVSLKCVTLLPFVCHKPQPPLTSPGQMSLFPQIISIIILFRAFLSPPRASQRLVQSLTINKWPVHCVQVSNTGDLYYHKLQKCLLSSNNLPYTHLSKMGVGDIFFKPKSQNPLGPASTNSK